MLEKTVDIELSDTEDTIHIYYNGEMVRSHPLTTEPFNYNTDDVCHILKSEVFAHQSDDDIHDYIKHSLERYDQVGGFHE